ncbi:MAG: glycoside hydrolase family 6 protein [Actinomycetota bacterium]|nr:glycoside hydrolase family 6 protein [Actinomycetota bacterium]
MRRPLLAALVVGALAAPMTATQAATANNPFAGQSFFVDPSSNAAKEVSADPDNATIWSRIADHAQADWFGDWYSTSTVANSVADRIRTIQAAGSLPVFVVYAVPQRDCGGYSSGGTNTPDDYKGWLDQFASGLGQAKAVVVLEPDALPMLDCLTGQDQQTRLGLLNWGVDRLNSQGNVSVYLDAGHSRWHSDATMAQRLADAGVAKARGFSLNVSNFHWTADEVAYGKTISDRIGGKPFVVDTSRNGLGPSADPNDPEPWCNPPDRALGTPSTAETGDPRVDALFWIKRPGESDGTCKGGPPAGAWWKDYAFGLADRAPWASDATAPTEPVDEDATADPAPTAPSLTVSQIEYSTNGGKHNDRHLNVSVAVTDATNPVPDATVTVDVYRNAVLQFRQTSTTGADGTVTFGYNNHRNGCYTTDVTLIQAAELSITDPEEPANSYAKGTTCPA